MKDRGISPPILPWFWPGSKRKIPGKLPQIIAEKLSSHSDLIERVEIAGPGFVNIFINHDVWRRLIPEIIAKGAGFGKSSIGARPEGDG